jgi:hypothetical protein
MISLAVNATYEALLMASFNVAMTLLWMQSAFLSQKHHSNISLNFFSISKSKKALKLL